MDSLIQNEKPRLVNAGQGFSHLNTVEYKGRFLYSKYNPVRAIETLIDSLEILPGTLVVVFSPLLWYGFEKLVAKMSENCRIIAIEGDGQLEAIARDSSVPFHHDRFEGLFNIKNTADIESRIKKLVSTGKIKRSLRIDFSAGVQFSKELYDYTAMAIQDTISVFWKNRLTLVKMGRLFSKNLFKNLSKMKDAILLDDMKQKVVKPLIVLGAGEGIDTIDWNEIDTKEFFIICVDASLQPLLDRQIIPDAVVGMESQFAIQKVYTGVSGSLENSDILFFADLSSRHEIIDLLGKKTVFFASKYSDGTFFNRLQDKGVVDTYMMPMGSVGLAAVYIACILRKDEDIPIYVSGLDFSYSIGTTHAKNTSAHKGRLAQCRRTIPVENYDAAYGPSSEYAVDKHGNRTITLKNMLSYAQQFRMFFSKTKNLYDASQTGLDLGIQQRKISSGKNLISGPSLIYDAGNNLSSSAKKFVDEERNSLEQIKDLLSQGEKSSFYDGNSLETQLKKLLDCREYLYLHFPDGYQLSMDTSFLKRIRAEVDYFLKLMKEN